MNDNQTPTPTHRWGLVGLWNRIELIKTCCSEFVGAYNKGVIYPINDDCTFAITDGDTMQNEMPIAYCPFCGAWLLTVKEYQPIPAPHAAEEQP